MIMSSLANAGAALRMPRNCFFVLVARKEDRSLLLRHSAAIRARVNMVIAESAPLAAEALVLNSKVHYVLYMQEARAFEGHSDLLLLQARFLLPPPPHHHSWLSTIPFPCSCLLCTHAGSPSLLRILLLRWRSFHGPLPTMRSLRPWGLWSTSAPEGCSLRCLHLPRTRGRCMCSWWSRAVACMRYAFWECSCGAQH